MHNIPRRCYSQRETTRPGDPPPAVFVRERGRWYDFVRTNCPPSPAIEGMPTKRPIMKEGCTTLSVLNNIANINKIYIVTLCKLFACIFCRVSTNYDDFRSMLIN